MLRASSPTATTLLSRTPTATTHGSLMTIPWPFRYTSTFAVPRSIPSRLANINPYVSGGAGPSAACGADAPLTSFHRASAAPLHTFHIRAQGAKFPFEVFVSTVEVEH